MTKTEEIVVRGTEIDESFRIDQSNGAFAPGTKAETTSDREIELEVTTSAGADKVLVAGTSGNDALHAVRRRRAPNDFIEGGDGSDQSVTDDSPVPLRGGSDTFRRTEKVTYSAPAGGGGPLLVGKLQLAASNNAVAGRVNRLNLGWKAPGGWRTLRQVKVRFSDGGTSVGTALINPRKSQATGAGSVRLDKAASRITHDGATVTASLGLRVPQSMAGRNLRVSVEATDRNGRRQYESDAGLLRVAA